jgi:hypothetical protein
MMPSVDFFCGDDRFIHLEEDWRRGLGWWLVDGSVRSRLSVSAATRLVPHLALEVLIEVQELVWRLETNAEYQSPSERLHGAVDGLRNELAAARAEHRNDPETSVRRFPMVAALTHQHAN